MEFNSNKTVMNPPRCRFDMFVRWNEKARRQKQTFTYRGDFFGVQDPDKMLCSLLKFFLKQHHQWQLAELYDNTKPQTDPERVILRIHKNKIEANRLHSLSGVLGYVALPEWLTSTMDQQ